MNEFLTNLAAINDKINGFVWVTIGLVLLIGTGVLMTVLTKCFQITHFAHWWKSTIGRVFAKDSDVHDKSDASATSLVSPRPSCPEAPVLSSGCGSPLSLV